jgi:tetratricopeptide (TPR) repeat protein
VAAVTGPRLGPQLAAIAAQLKAGDYRQARASAIAAATLPAASPMELVELARRLVQFNLSGDLRELVARLLAAPIGNAAAEADVAALLSMQGDQDRAGRLLDRAMAVIGPHPAHLYNRSQMRLYGGRLDDAERDLRQALAREPTMARAHWALSKLPAGAASAAGVGGRRAGRRRAAGAGGAGLDGRGLPGLRLVQPARSQRRRRGRVVRVAAGGAGAPRPARLSPRSQRAAVRRAGSGVSRARVAAAHGAR